MWQYRLYLALVIAALFYGLDYGALYEYLKHNVLVNTSIIW
ncbi:hypothetical protein [Clostridium guangxiense]|nr:hypothetical protein [Clostridium guangxiense]